MVLQGCGPATLSTLRFVVLENEKTPAPREHLRISRICGIGGGQIVAFTADFFLVPYSRHPEVYRIWKFQTYSHFGDVLKILHLLQDDYSSIMGINLKKHWNSGFVKKKRGISPPPIGVTQVTQASPKGWQTSFTPDAPHGREHTWDIWDHWIGFS